MSNGSFDNRMSGLLRQMPILLSPAAAAFSSSFCSNAPRRVVSESAVDLLDLNSLLQLLSEVAAAAAAATRRCESSSASASSSETM